MQRMDESVRDAGFAAQGGTAGPSPATAAAGRAHAHAPIDPRRIKVIACATVIEEMASHMPTEMDREVMDFGLHLHPGSLTEALQERIDASVGYDYLLLGYGLCSNAVVGLAATTATLVIPRVHDCIAIFLGSGRAYRDQARGEPGTYYLTKGWIEVGDSPLHAQTVLAERYGEERAARMVALTLRNYRRLAFINTGTYDLERYRAWTREAAERFGLRFEEIQGEPTLVEKLLYGPWDEECLVVQRGDVVGIEPFIEASNPTAGRA